MGLSRWLRHVRVGRLGRCHPGGKLARGMGVFAEARFLQQADGHRRPINLDTVIEFMIHVRVNKEATHGSERR